MSVFIIQSQQDPSRGPTPHGRSSSCECFASHDNHGDILDKVIRFLPDKIIETDCETVTVWD